MRRRVTALVALVSTAIVASFAIPLLFLVAALAADRGMTTASQEANTLAMLVAGIRDPTDLAAAVGDAAAHLEGQASVVLAGGTTIGDAWADSDDDPEFIRAASGEAFSVRDDAGGRVFVPVLVANGVAVVRVAMTPDQLRQGVPAAWASIVGLSLLLCAVTMVVAARASDLVSRPLRDVAATAHRLREGDLDARAPVVGPPETMEVAEALNRLAGRIDSLLNEERMAVGALAHRLRTPATALRLETDAVADAELAGRMRSSLAQLEAGIDAVVTEARRPARPGFADRADAVAVARERLAHWLPLAEDQGRPVASSFPAGELRVGLGVADLGDAVDVLIDNVFDHTPEGTALRVSVRRLGDGVVIEVSDDGPGLPARDEPAGPGSSRLGLEIVAGLAERAGGRLVLPLAGATHPTFRIELPRAAD